MTRFQFARRPDRRGSALGSTSSALRHPWTSHHLSVCGHLQPCRWSAWWPASFQAARKRMWIVHWADAQLGTSDAPQQGTSQPKVRVGEQSEDNEVVAAQIRLRGRDQASKKWPNSRVNSQVRTLNTHRPSVKFLSVCLSVCLSVPLSLSHCLSVSTSVSQVCPCICRSGVWCEVPTCSPSPSDLSSQTIPLFTSLFTPPSVRCKRHGRWMKDVEREISNNIFSLICQIMRSFVKPGSGNRCW